MPGMPDDYPPHFYTNKEDQYIFHEYQPIF